jgi:hypothetical protein
MFRALAFIPLCLGFGFAQNDSGAVIPRGTQIRIRTDQTIDARDHSDGRIFPATVAEDVRAGDGRLIVPRDARAELIVQNVSENNLAVDLESITVNGRRYMVAAKTYDTARRTTPAPNRKTGEYAGGGAIFGAIIGAIAGGGKGAAIGAVAGGAAGAGAEVLTRGREIRIPAETVLTFRLQEPLEVGHAPYNNDNGYDRDGYHYHNDYYHRDAEPRQ